MLTTRTQIPDRTAVGTYEWYQEPLTGVKQKILVERGLLVTKETGADNGCVR